VAAPVLVLAVVASLVLRVRHYQGDERQQLKWLTYVVAVDAAMPWTVGVAAERSAPLVGELLVFPVAASLIPVAIGVAVLEYRLYDLDRVISRTLVYGLLTVLLGAVYAAGVFALGASWPWRRHLLGAAKAGSSTVNQALAAVTLLYEHGHRLKIRVKRARVPKPGAPDALTPDAEGAVRRAADRRGVRDAAIVGPTNLREHLVCTGGLGLRLVIERPTYLG
jgi:hypothetical protein